MAAVNSGVLACSSAGPASLQLNGKQSCIAASGYKVPVIKAQHLQSGESQGRLAAIIFTAVASISSANAGIIEDYLEKSKAQRDFIFLHCFLLNIYLVLCHYIVIVIGIE